MLPYLSFFLLEDPVFVYNFFFNRPSRHKYILNGVRKKRRKSAHCLKLDSNLILLTI